MKRPSVTAAVDMGNVMDIPAVKYSNPAVSPTTATAGCPFVYGAVERSRQIAEPGIPVAESEGQLHRAPQ